MGLVKIQSMILGKGLHFLFERFGWCAGLVGIFMSYWGLGGEPDAGSPVWGNQVLSGESGGSEARKGTASTSEVNLDLTLASPIGHDPAAPPVVGEPNQATSEKPVTQVQENPRFSELHSMVKNQVRQYTERGVNRNLSRRLPEREFGYSEVATDRSSRYRRRLMNQLFKSGSSLFRKMQIESIALFGSSSNPSPRNQGYDLLGSFIFRQFVKRISPLKISSSLFKYGILSQSRGTHDSIRK